MCYNYTNLDQAQFYGDPLIGPNIRYIALVRYIAENDEEPLTLHEPPPKAYLLLLANQRISQTFPIRGEVHLGRDKGNSVVVSDQKVSRFHASLSPIDDAFILNDKGSANGTYLNGVLISQPVRLKDKDHISLGDTHFLFSTTPPDEDNLEAVIPALPKAPSTPTPAGSTPALAMPALDDKSIWLLVGCLGLVIVGLMVMLALLVGLMMGRGFLAGTPELIWLFPLI